VSGPLVTVVGIGADGWAGLPAASRAALCDAEVVLGSDRQFALLDESVTAVRELWPSPLMPALPGVIDSHAGQRLAVLASGDPMFYGIGSTLVRLLGRAAVNVLPHPSSVSLAAARLGWPLEDVDVVSLVGRPLATLHPAIQPGRRVLVLVASTTAADEVRALLDARGYGGSAVTVLERLGGPDERVRAGADADADTGTHDPLAIVAVTCVLDVGIRPLPRTPGLPEDAFDHGGQITKREIRVLVLAALVPVPGQLLWDVGAGSGSVGIEWMRVHPASRAVAIEPREDRRRRIAANADALGVPGLQIVAGSAPDALAGLPVPDAVFVGGGVSLPGVIDACLAALPVGGRLVADAVTVETEVVLASWHARLGGTLTRIAVQRAEPVGGFTGWRPAMPVTQWSYLKGES
jgi:precorrin-6B C5,15-methyltransferase / cobalt-precorrin-6B C5,C15-methyltransferase